MGKTGKNTWVLDVKLVIFKHVYIVCAAFWKQLDKTTAAHTWRWISVSWETGGKLLLPWNLTCQFTCSLPSPLPSSLPSFLPSFLPPFLPQLQRPHRLRCFTQRMKCLKDTESVSPHGHGFLSAGLPGGTRLSFSVSCMHSSSSAWIYGWPGSAHVQSTKQQLQETLHSLSHMTAQSICAVRKQASLADLKIDIYFQYI